MKPASYKVLKSLTIFLFPLVFFTPAPADAFSACWSRKDHKPVFHFDLKREKNSSPFLAEGTDTEEEQLEDQLERISTLLVAEVIVQTNSELCGRKLNSPVKGCMDNLYDIRPPFFKLYCLLLI